MNPPTQLNKCARKLAYAMQAEAEGHSAWPECRIVWCAECAVFHVEGK
jgi:hypothetical protein